VIREIKTEKREKECYGGTQRRPDIFGLRDGRDIVTTEVTFHDISVDWCGL
jgi:hypothetical protein